MTAPAALGLAILLMTVCTTLARFTVGFQAWLPSAAMLVCFWYAWVFLERAALALSFGLAFAAWASASGALTAAVGVLVLGERLTTIQGVAVVALAASAVVLLASSTAAGSG